MPANFNCSRAQEEYPFRYSFRGMTNPLYYGRLLVVAQQPRGGKVQQMLKEEKEEEYAYI
ncbi:hypothetical protein KSC_100910 [Ktedonobacter sp. SOSP1-52]|nr:hypothetical protein KSC_100910 [Ktedonobacter sp. SOSP1-52]